jgi:predicted permease
MGDVRVALRQLRKAPLFVCAAVATLAIGTAATTAIFSTVNATLLRPLPFPHPDALVNVHTRLTDGRITTGLLSTLEMEALTDLPDVVEGAAGLAAQPLDATFIGEDGTPVAVLATGVTEGFFDVLGLPMALGRAFNHDEHVRAGRGQGPGNLVVVASYRAWKTLLGGDPAIAGRTIRIAEAGRPIRVVGIASPALDLPHGVDFWFNLRTAPGENAHNYDTILRLRPGATIGELRAAATAKMAILARTEPSDAAREYVIRPLVSSMVGDLATMLLIVLGATALLLILASVNVANLLLARGTGRARETAIRAALGASRSRIVRQMLVESALLAVAGVIAGVVLAMAMVRVMLNLGAASLPRLHTVPFDLRVMFFAAAVLVCSVILMGIAPAWRLSRTDIRALLNESGRSATPSRATSRMMGGLIVGEIALALALVAGAGWLVQSFARLRSTDPGFIASGRLVLDIRPTRAFKGPPDVHAWLDALQRTVRTASGDARVGAATTFPFRADRDGTLNVQVVGAPEIDMKGARVRSAGPGFFEALGVRLVAGRLFTDADRRDTARVAIVNRAFVRTFVPDDDPLGHSFAVGYPTVDPASTSRIVGVVDDMRYKSLAEEPQPACYFPLAQLPFPPLRQVFVIAPRHGDPEALVSPIRAAITRFDPQAVAVFDTGSSIVADTLRRQRLGMTLMLLFGAVALTLAAIGIYGVIAYAAAQRRAEIATRLALGASRWDVFRLMMGSGQQLGLAGIVAGLALAYVGGRIVASSVFEMRAWDPIVLISACSAVTAVTLVAIAIPAVRACRIDPGRALRGDER